jgi:hypothetical protein
MYMVQVVHEGHIDPLSMQAPSGQSIHVDSHSTTFGFEHEAVRVINADSAITSCAIKDKHHLETDL